MYSPNFVIGIYGPKSIQKHITVETEAAPYEITIGLLEICSLGHRRQIWHNHRKVDVWDDIWTSYRDLVFSQKWLSSGFSGCLKPFVTARVRCTLSADA